MMIALPNSAPAIDRFLCDVRSYDVDQQRTIQNASDTPLDKLAALAVLHGSPELGDDVNDHGESTSTITIPVYRDGSVVSVVALTTASRPNLTGVFEVWSPVGEYEELSLSQGFFGDLARFRNVSSFVRFEKGSGLPGQVWEQNCGVIHDNLPDHPGFLRAAGASADRLKTAIGIPVGDSSFNSAVVLISSDESPIANGFEVWRAGEHGFVLESAAYHDPEIASEIGATLTLVQGLAGLAREHGGATTSENQTILSAGRECETGKISSGLAIPSYHGNVLTSVTTLLF